MLVNVNNLVWFRLTDAGEVILDNHITSWNKECPDGPLNKRQFRAKNWYYVMQLHEAMRIFGPHTYQNPFEKCEIFTSEPAQ